MQALLFERPAYLIPAVVLAELVLLLIWRRWPTPATRQAARLGLILFPLMIVVQSLVTTDRERIVLVCRQLASAVEDADTDRLADYLSDDIIAQSAQETALNKAALLARLSDMLNKYHVEELRLRDIDVEFGESIVRVRFRAICRVVAKSSIYPRIVTLWLLRLESVDQGWRVSHIQQLRSPITGLDLLSGAF
ncbi:MAG: nuclear transport factor 2 family protein [Planctomycetes bacterium]|nr:nuclear transport factor 2 family protein [Planctomycetota bacterium]